MAHRSPIGPGALLALSVTLSACGGSGAERPGTVASPPAFIKTHPALAAHPASAVATAAAKAPVAYGGSATPLEQALLSQKAKPSPTAAHCRNPTSAERNASPFGRTRLPVFSCAITVSSTTSRFDVQVLANGCFVAERRRPGQAIYGCGVRR